MACDAGRSAVQDNASKHFEFTQFLGAGVKTSCIVSRSDQFSSSNRNQARVSVCTANATNYKTTSIFTIFNTQSPP
jgi:tellurite resistance protein